MILCFDIDGILFPAASIAETKYIEAKHIPTGKVMEFDNRSALWGHWKKKEGGWIALQNELSGEIIYKPEDFEIVDKAKLRPFKVVGQDGQPDSYLSPLDGAKKIITDKINEIMAKTMAESYFGYTGEGTVFRQNICTLLPYKGNREKMLTPILLKELKKWVCEEHNITLVHDYEADDYCNIAMYESYKNWVKNGRNDEDIVVQVSFDKDAKGNTGFLFNPDKDKAPRLIEGLGKLWLNEKDEVDGEGRMWLYWQILHGDSTDNYIANCFSDKKYAGKGAYNDLKDCKTDKEAFQVMVDKFKWMYPEKKIVKTFRGDIEIDAMYVFQEMADMAMMLRYEGDKLDVKKVCLKLGVSYEEHALLFY